MVTCPWVVEKGRNLVLKWRINQVPPESLGVRAELGARDTAVKKTGNTPAFLQIAF